MGFRGVCVGRWLWEWNPIAMYISELDWDETGEDQGDKQLWEDNWDDDNVEDEFSCQLR